MIRTTNSLFSALILSLALAGCTQTTPSMMNSSHVELSHETIVEQIALKDINDTMLTTIAENHRKYGTGDLELAMTFDPKSKSFTAMKAAHEIKHISQALKYKGVQNIKAQTLAVPDGKPSLMVSYDMLRAQKPSDCEPMPGIEHNQTGRFIGEYKFGCGVETMFAQQIANPSDLQGKDGLAKRDARREAVVVEEYSAGVPRTPLEGVERDGITSGQ